MRNILYGVLLAFFAGTAGASDHIDGPVTKRTPFSDLTDLYAFPSPGEGNLVLALDSYPIAPSDAHPASRVSFALILRRAERAAAGVWLGEELRFDCTFPPGGHPHRVACSGSNGLRSSAVQNSTEWSGDFPLFFGRRSDPFFFDADWSETVSTEGRLPPPGRSNTMSSLNVLSLVIELDRSQVFGGNFTLLAVAAESLGQDEPGDVPVRLDRLGRPEITNVTLVAHEGEEDLRDDYNKSAPFAEPARAADYRARISRNIAYYDRLDGRTDWQDQAARSWAALLTDDFLLVDISKPCAGDHYLEIERALIAARPHRSCGGRKLTDDIMDRLYTLYINGGRAAIGDGVDAPDAVPLARFPYLAEPTTGLWAWLKAVIADSRVR